MRSVRWRFAVPASNRTQPRLDQHQRLSLACKSRRSLLERNTAASSASGQGALADATSADLPKWHQIDLGMAQPSATSVVCSRVPMVDPTSAETYAKSVSIDCFAEPNRIGFSQTAVKTAEWSEQRFCRRFVVITRPVLKPTP